VATALKNGKTVFFVLSQNKHDRGAVSYQTVKGSRNYQTKNVDNYSLLPSQEIKVRNASGKTIIAKDPLFRGLLSSCKELFYYQVVIEDFKFNKIGFTTKDGTPIGGVIRFKDWPGALVLLPYLDFSDEDFSEISEDDEITWSNKALSFSSAFVSQVAAIDKALKSASSITPPPEWMQEIETPKEILYLNNQALEFDRKIEELKKERSKLVSRKNELLNVTHLLYENGKNLEAAINLALKLIGYDVESLRIGDFEVDHVIISPNGTRFIGESEGKDNSAIDITKFRQLESNIGEDFERDEIETPAKGILFGNGFRLMAPSERPDQFTQKCLTNAKRLGSILIRTSDLYALAVYILDNPDCEDFKVACRNAIESTSGEIVTFPKPKHL